MTQAILSHIERRPGLSFHASLMVGAMLAVLAVVVYASLATTVGALRTGIILQGMEVILLTLAAGFIASALHAVGTASEPKAGAARARNTSAA